MNRDEDLRVVDVEELNEEEHTNGLSTVEEDGHEDEGGDAALYDSSILSTLSFSHLQGVFKPHIENPAQPSPGLRVRSLRTGDYDRGFLQLLAQLTKVGDISREDFLSKWFSS